MGRELYDSEPSFAAEVDRCAEILGHLGMDIREVLFSAGRRNRPGMARTCAPCCAGMRPLSTKRGGAWPARSTPSRPCFVVEYALARLLMSWGVRPQAMIGYSLGEYVAAGLAGVLSLEDALALVARRAKLIQDLPDGAMLAVPLPESEVRPLLGRGSPSRPPTAPTSASWRAGRAVAELESRLAGRGATACACPRPTPSTRAMMEPAVAPLTAIARG